MDHERSRKNLAEILRGVSDLGGTRVAELLGVSSGTVSKMQSRHKEKGNPDIKVTFPAIADLLAACGKKVVPSDWKCVDPETFQMLWTGHKKYMEAVKSPDDLMFEEPE